MAVSIRLSDLSKRFGETRAVDDVTLVIEPGELFFLLGPSGCGKTTLLRCIAGFCRPDAGTIHLGDTDISHLPPHQRDTGMVFQSYALWPHMTVRDNVGFGLELRRLPAAERQHRIEEALTMVRMLDRAGYRPNELSGGQQQRVALARALVIRPKCLLLDEPLSNLDAKLRLEMRTEIRRICKQAGLTAVYVTHDQKEALSIADRLAVLEGGRVAQCGNPQEVYLRPNSRFVANFIGETNFVQGAIVSARPGEIVVETAFGRVVSAVEAPSVREGAEVTLSLRPETIHLGPPPAGTANVFEGHVHDTVYQGELAQQQVNLPAAGRTPLEQPTVLRAFEMNPRIVARDEDVVRTKLWLDPKDVVVLTK